MMKKDISKALIMSVIAGLGYSSYANAVSLQEAVSVVVGTNPEIGVTVKDRRATEYQLRQARGQYYPQIDVSFTGGPEFAENASVDFGSRTARPRDNGRTLFRQTGRATLTQLLFDGFATDSQVEQQIAQTIAAAHRIQDQTQVSALQAVQAYVDVLRHKERLEAAEENIAAHRVTLELVRRRSDLGGGNIADVRQTEARLATAETTMKQIEGDLREAEATFERVVGYPASNLEPVTPVKAALADNVEKAVLVGLQNNPRIREAKSNIEASEAQIRGAEAPFYPNINLQVSGTQTSEANGIEETTTNASALVIASYNLYRGGSDLAAVREAKERRSAALETLRVQERQVAEQVRISWSQWLTQTNRTQTLTDQVTANRLTREVYLQQFDIGQRSLLDLLDSTNELFIARVGLIDATYLELFAEHQLLASTGQLVQTLGVAFPKEATPTEIDLNSDGQAVPQNTSGTQKEKAK